MQLAEFPLDPQTAKMLLQSYEYGCSDEILTIAAMLQVSEPVIARVIDFSAGAACVLKPTKSQIVRRTKPVVTR